MQAVNVIGLMEYIDEVITVLGESGVFHPDEVSNFYTDLQEFTHLQTKNSYAEPLTNLKAALNQTKRRFPLTDVSDFSPTFEELDSFSKETTADIDALIDERESAAARCREAKHNLSTAEHFAGLDVQIQEVLKMKYMKAHFGRLPKDSMQKLEAYKDNEYVDFAVCTEDKTHCWGVYFAPAEQADEIDKIFEGLYFEPTDLVGENETPSEKIEGYKKEIPLLEKKTKEAQKKLDRYLSENMERITRYLSKLEELYLYASIRNKALQHENSFIIVGWIPTENMKQMKKRLKKIKSVELDFSDAKNEMDKRPPVKLKKMPIGKILFPCGISSMVFGTLFGSVFGFEHLLDPMFRLFGFEEKPFEVMASQNTNLIILGAIGIGVFLLIVAMFLNVYTSFRQKNYGRALFSTSGIAGIIFYCSLVFGLTAEIFLGMHVMTLPYILGLVVLPFLLIFFAEPLGDLVNGEKDWQPESWGGYIVENLFESIEVLLGYVTNTMSFLRVGAFVLVHAGMMLVVFVLAETVGGAGYWIIVVIGNALVMVLEALLVAIQVLRLEYYEMFSRFYSGEGRPFEPVKINVE